MSIKLEREAKSLVGNGIRAFCLSLQYSSHFPGWIGQRDTMFHYLQKRFHKPSNVEPQDHLMRHMALMRATKKLQGTSNPPTAEEEKDWYISQYDMKWREKYDFKHDEGIANANQSLLAITEFMQKLWDKSQRRKKHWARHRHRNKKRKYNGHRHKSHSSSSSSSSGSSSDSSSDDSNKHQS